MKRNIMKRNAVSYLIVFAVILVSTSLLLGCSAAKAASTTAAPSVSAASGNAISIESNAFNPSSLTVKVGDTVTWTNKDSYAHTVKGKNGEFDSGNIASGATFSFKFDKEGTVDYICAIHTFMTGKIIVTK
jgi:plastocyanin